MTDALVLFDDAVARAWRPFTLTRPGGELLFGTRTLRARAERAFGLQCAGHVTAAHLSSFDEPWAPPVLAPDTLPREGRLVLLSSRLVAEPASLPEGPALLTAADRVVGAVLRPGDPAPPREFYEDPDHAAPDMPRHPVEGRLLVRVWELMACNADRLARDLANATAAASLPDGVHHVSAGTLSLGADVVLAPGTVLDTRHGPIRLENGVQVHPFTHLVGPAWIGTRSVLLGGPYEALSVGPVCRVHGEIEESVILGYSNKAHDGFLGHAYVGMWVNLGALTTNSDLKNNYGSVRVWTPAGERDTGERKVGCLLGDHVKTAIGTMLNTGTVVEAGSNVFGGMPPKYVPPFSWGEPDTAYDAERFLATAETVMGRRDVALSDAQRALLRAAWDAGRG